MVKRYPLPQLKVTVGTKVFIGKSVIRARIARLENGFDTATVDFTNYQSATETYVQSGASIKIEIKDASESEWTTVFNGVIRFAIETSPHEVLTAKCDGAGFGFGCTVVGQEYGTQSQQHPTLDTLTEILTDESAGIVPKWVNKILGGTGDSGFAYDTSKVDNITESIGFVTFPFKLCNKAIDDLCDLVTAIRSKTDPANAGPHWLVDVSNNLHVKLISSSQLGWPKYYGGTQGAATLVQGKHFKSCKFEPSEAEANYILYAGAFLWPPGEYYTENHVSEWDVAGSGASILDNNYYYKVGGHSVRCQTTGATGAFWFPKTGSLGLNVNKLGSSLNVPYIMMYVDKDNASGMSLELRLEKDSTHYFSRNLTDDCVSDQWTHLTYPIGPYYNTISEKSSPWTDSGGDWAALNKVSFHLSGGVDPRGFWLDELLSTGPLTRAAKNSTKIASDKLKVKVITDNVAKYDSLNASDDSGTMARLAHAELLRCQSKITFAEVATGLIPDLLPGQLMHIHAKRNKAGTFLLDADMRVTRLEHALEKAGGATQIWLTDDLKNSHSRLSYLDYNKVAELNRPQNQDRQATSLKSFGIDIFVPILEVDYPS